jgi:hypothetical protein
MVSRSGAGGAFSFYYGYALSPRFTLGLKLTASSDFRAENALEGAAFFRWNIRRWGILPDSPLPRFVFFVQAGAGAAYYTVFKNSNPPRYQSSFLAEASTGLRIYISPNGKPFFIEPSVRCAYPSVLGVGVTFGI